jgi:ABC-type glycerol-3-phosphate transport system permease component
MNPVHIVLVMLFSVFILLYALWPHRPRIARAYLRYLVLTLAAVLVLSPFIWLIAASFKDPSVLNKYVFFPPLGEWGSETLNLKNFVELFKGEETLQGTVYFWRYLGNSVFLASCSTVVQLFFSSLGGFALAKYTFNARKIVLGFMLATMMIPPVILIAPMYKLIVNIGWVDSYLALIWPGACSVFGMFLFRQAIVVIPNDLIEAARIDGCSEFKIYWNLIMPLVRPMSGAFCMLTFLGSWNSFIAPDVFLHTQAKLPLPVVLNQYVGVYTQQYGVFLAGTLIAIVLPAILFFSLQREFISGITSGAIEG